MELLVRIVDKPQSGDVYLDAGRTVAGDVIAFAPDGHIWGREEVRNPDWRIIRVPGMQRVEAEATIGTELPEAFAPNRLLRKRQFALDIEQLDIMEGGTILAERSATPKSVDAVVSPANFRACRSLKPKLTDPRFIGPRKEVIG
jgi:hypothetical protein